MEILCYMNFSYALALSFQQQVVDAWASHGSTATEVYKEASRLLEEMKKKAFGPLTDAVIQEAFSLASKNDSVPTKDVRVQH